MIAIIDYGMGNLRSVGKAFEALGAQAEVTEDRRRIVRADKLVLPGVGAFGKGMAELGSRKLIPVIKEAIENGKPFLGVCLGLQLLFDESEEMGRHQGLGVIRGKVKRLRGDVKIPHMGWNQIQLKVTQVCPIFKGIPNGAFFYFVHSYVGVPEDRTVISATCRYGETFASALWRDNLFATQFHPEKSQALGLALLKNFLRL